MALTIVVASAAWLSPLAIDQLARRSIGQALFDWPWLTLHFANTITAVSLIAALVVITLKRRLRLSDYTAALTPWIGLAALCFAFGLVPVVKLTVGLSSDVIVAGMLPALDAQSYFAAALNLLQTGQLSEWGTRRPLTATQLAGLLTLTGQNFRLVLLLLAAGCAAAAALITITLYRAYGSVAAFLGAVSLFAFIYQTLGSTMSESLGFAAGGAGFVLLWESARKARPSLALAGIFMLSIGLAARAGAMFVLPVLAIWAGWCFAGGRRFHWGWAGGALIAAAAGFFVNYLLIAVIGASEQAAFSNFASTLYGLAIGGKPWTQIFIDAPHLTALPEGEQAAAIYRLAWEHALQSPQDPIIGILVRYNEFLFKMRWLSYVPAHILRLPILLLAIAGVVHSFRHRNEPVFALLLAGMTGILLSAPFLGDGGSRVFAATHGFMAALIATGTFAFQQWLAAGFVRQEHPATDGFAISNAASALAIVTLVPMLVAVAGGGLPRAVAGVTPILSCAPGEAALRAVTPRNGDVLICSPGSACRDGVRAESLGRTNIWKSPHLSGLNAILPARVAEGLDTNTGNGIWLLATGDLAMPEGLFTACVRPHGEWLELMPPHIRP